jgi:hypothetical protein
MKTRLFVAVLLALLAIPAMAQHDPFNDPKYPGVQPACGSLTAQVRKFEKARKIERAEIEAMIDPPGSFAITYWGKDVGSQCPINPSHEFTITLRPDLDGDYINNGCTHEGPIPCFCDIYVRTYDTKRAWQAALEPYQQQHKLTLPIDPSPDAKVRSDGVSYSVGVNANYVALALGPVAEVKRGDEFTVALNASVPLSSESPCSDPKGRPCQLTTELWQLLPNGSRQLLEWPFENADQSVKVWLKAGEQTRVSLKGRFRAAQAVDPIPKGKAVLVAKWFLLKHHASLVDYQVPVGSFEIPVNIK